MSAPLVGLGFGPVIAVALIKVLPNWHWVFGVVAIPGLFIAWAMFKFLRDDTPTPAEVAETEAPEVQMSWRDVFKYRAVIVNTLGMFCWLSCLIVLSAFMPSYLTDQLKLSLDQMGMVLSGLGLGSFIGMVLVPAISDKLGRKPVMIVALLIELGALWLLPTIGAQTTFLFWALFIATFMNAGVVAITVGPLTSGAVPQYLATTATGFVVGLGEIVGGAVAPAVAGGLAQNYGIGIILEIAFYSILLGIAVVVIGMKHLPTPAIHSSVA